MSPTPRQPRAGAPDAATPKNFVEFYRHHAESLLVFFTRRTFDIEAARDLTAETFAEAFRHRRRFHGSTAADAAGWLYGIARHRLAHYVRDGAVEGRALQRLGVQLSEIRETDIERVVELAGLVEMRQRVSTALASLDRDQRLALKLRVVDERPYSAVAEALGVSEQTARARVSRGLKRLAGAVEMSAPSEVGP